MAHVFISYSHQDEKDIFEEFQNELEKVNLEYWTDEKLSPGVAWSRTIDDALKSSFAVVVILSPTAVESQYVTYEWSFALGLGKAVIPILAVRGTKIHPKLSELQHVDLTSRARDWSKLITRLIEIHASPQLAVDINPNEQDMLPELSNPNSSVRRNVIQVAVAVQNKSIIPNLLGILNDNTEKPTVREDAAWALGELNAEEATSLLLFTLINTKGQGIKRAAANSLGKIKAISAIPALLDILKFERDDDLKKITVNSIVTIASEEKYSSDVVNNLRTSLNNRDFMLARNYILNALTQIGTRHALKIVEEWENEHPTSNP